MSTMEVQMVKRVAMLFGVVFILVGVLGLFMSDAGMSMSVDANAKPLLGLFPVNLPHYVVHILFGVWGLMAARSFAGAQTFCKVGGVIYLVLACLGVVSSTGWGLIPVGGNDVWLHALLGLVLAAVGFTAQPEPAATTSAA